jgi:hypothetical protein
MDARSASLAATATMKLVNATKEAVIALHKYFLNLRQRWTADLFDAYVLLCHHHEDVQPCIYVHSHRRASGSILRLSTYAHSSVPYYSRRAHLVHSTSDDGVV